MGEARLCRRLLGDGGNIWKFKWIETEFGVCCVNPISRSGILKPKRQQQKKLLECSTPIKVFNEVLFFLGPLINAMHLVNELIE